MTEGGFAGAFTLISNPEWMTIARDVENVATNWSGGSVGSGCLFRGNVGLADACGHDATTDPESGPARDTKARLTLSNGSQIWDFAGNVWEWTDWDAGNAGFNSGPTNELVFYKEFSVAPTGSLVSDDFKPSGAYISTHGVGKWYGGSGGGLRAAVEAGTMQEELVLSRSFCSIFRRARARTLGSAAPIVLDSALLS